MGLLDDAIREHLDLKRARGADPAEIERSEREALGPVRRGHGGAGMRLEPGPQAEHTGHAAANRDGVVARDLEPGHEERFADLDDLQELGYNDSTAPHHHPHFDQHSHEGYDDHESGLAYESPAGEEWANDAGAPSQPKRRFLRRGRLPPAGDQLFEGEGEGEGAQHPTVAGDPFPGDDSWREAMPAPPALEFTQPPRRPHFSTDPPEQDAEPLTEAASTPSPEPEPSQATPLIHSELGTQETTEFDVEQHLAATPPLDEDVLEKTPEFLQDTPEHDRLWFEQRPPRDFDFDG